MSKNESTNPESIKPEPKKTLIDFLWKHPAIVGSTIYILFSCLVL